MTETFADGGFTLTTGRVAVLTISRPERRNAATEAMWAALPDICARIADDAEIRALIVRGQGDRAFCAGADMSEFARVYATVDSTTVYNGYVRAAQASLRNLRCPTIAAVQGACYGGGCGLALACDLRVADGSAGFAITPARLGLAYSPADTWQVIEKVGVTRARDLLLTGRTVKAEEAAAIGLIDRLCSTNAIAAALTLADDLAAMSADALSAIKTITNGLSRPAITPDLVAAFDATFRGPDFREGYSAFLDKRSPDFERRTPE